MYEKQLGWSAQGSLSLGAALGALILSTGHAIAQQELFGHDNANHAIVQIDTMTGTATVVGLTGFNSGASGMATSRGVVSGPSEDYASGTHFGILRDNALVKDFVVAVDTVTGETTKIVQTSRNVAGRGVAFGSDGVTLFVLEGNGKLSTVDTVTGDVALVHDDAPRSVSLEHDPETAGFVSLVGNVATRFGEDGVVDSQVEIGGLGSSCTLARDEDGVWWTASAGDLVQLDIEAGTATVVGALGAAASNNICGTAFAPVQPLTLAVNIDIKPNSDPSCFNNNGHGSIPVAILGSDVFDVSQVDVATVSLEGLAVRVVGRADKALAHSEDYNNDGYLDLILQIQDVDGTFESGHGEATLSGELLDGTAFEGVGDICITQ